MGSSVRSGTACALVVHTGRATVFGQIAKHLTLRPPETEFECGIRHFGALLTQIMLVIALIVSTRRPDFRSKPGRLLWLSTLIVAIVTLIIPYLPFSALLGFTPLPVAIIALLCSITALYVLTAEVAKKRFYTWMDRA